MFKIAVAGLLVAVSLSAAAEGMYAGGALGQSHYSIDCQGASSCDVSDVALKLYFGVQSSQTAGFELGYVNVGSARGQVSYAGIPVDLELKSHGVLLNGVLRHAVTPEFSVLGRLGLSILNSKVSGSSSGVNVSDSLVSFQPYFGLGLEYAVTSELRLTAAADFTKAEAEFNGVKAKSNVRMLSLGAQYGF